MSNETVCRVGQHKSAHILAYHYTYKHIAHVFAA